MVSMGMRRHLHAGIIVALDRLSVRSSLPVVVPAQHGLRAQVAQRSPWLAEVVSCTAKSDSQGFSITLLSLARLAYQQAQRVHRTLTGRLNCFQACALSGVAFLLLTICQTVLTDAAS